MTIRPSESILHVKVATIAKSSPKRLIEGGSAKFINLLKSQAAVSRGNIIKAPREPISLRVWLRSYQQLARQNKADETIPCANIKISAPTYPHVDPLRIPAATSAIWPTEEYAIKDFRSVCRKQMIPTPIIPQRPKPKMSSLDRVLIGPQR